uniref:Alpha-latroinsectotoxin-Lh1a (Fragments) n=1 Tax=Latrodectus hasselti TaxID=256736 RepID=LITA_LATHA|nr:RecName: Full=Alpha-latroinsectotoxin-Lh1a; Short=Alpha-LIT-Lh1a; AltName: Full=Alpha-latroinsectotoxin; Short=Alpha-LIT [Latrodectus hasseltii]
LVIETIENIATKLSISISFKTDVTQTLIDITEIDLNAQDKILIRNTNAVINIKSKVGLTPLHLATLQNNLSVSKGAYLNDGDANGMTPLHYAAMTGNLEMVDFLKWTPLHLAILFKQLVIELLAKTFFDLAIENGRLNIVAFAVEKYIAAR